MNSLLGKLKLVLWIAIFAIPAVVSGQGANTNTNAAPIGPLSVLGHLAVKNGIEDGLPAQLIDLLWPEAGKGQQKSSAKKILIPGKHEGEGRVLFVRAHSRDIVLMQHSEKIEGDSKTRQETYYRTTVKGDLTLALKATFEFGKDTADSDVLKKATWQTYGAISGDGAKPLPITSDIKSKFEAEKKFWLEQEKKQKKLESRQKK